MYLQNLPAKRYILKVRRDLRTEIRAAGTEEKILGT